LVSFHVVAAVLGVVLDDEDEGVVPVAAARSRCSSS